MDRTELRKEIDRIDDQMVKLFSERMGIAEQIAEFKKANNLPVLDSQREREKLHSILAQTQEEYKEYISTLYTTIFELSRSCQNRRIGLGSDLTDKIQTAVENTPKLFPSEVLVACQGVEGAYSQIACDKLVRNANIKYFNSFDGVFTAIENGECRLGVVPIENSTAGSVNQVYDLMMKHNFSIVRSIRIKVDHNLLVKPGTRLEDIKEIYSHQQAISQCSEFLSKLKDVKVIPCENTAIAAKNVSQAADNSTAAISSRACMKLYGLEAVEEQIQNQDNNFTRFICISKELEIYPGADRTSLLAVLPHEPGSLYKLLSRFYALGINLIKLESRPLPDRNFEFMFYFDLDASVYDPRLMQLCGELSGVCEHFTYLGSYSEVV